MPEAGLAVRRAIAVPRSRIGAAEGICDRVLKRLQASLSGAASRQRHHAEAVSHPIKHFGQRSNTISDFIIIFGVIMVVNKRHLHFETNCVE